MRSYLLTFALICPRNFATKKTLKLAPKIFLLTDKNSTLTNLLKANIKKCMIASNSRRKMSKMDFNPSFVGEQGNYHVQILLYYHLELTLFILNDI